MFNLFKNASIFYYLYNEKINETSTIDNYNTLIYNLNTVMPFPKSK